MSNEIILLMHPTFGALSMLAAVWVFVEALNASQPGVARMRTAATISAVLMWLAYLTAGYFYVLLYGPDKEVIKAGPWPFAHNLVTETKEHVFLMLILLVTFLPIAAAGPVATNRGARRVVLWSSAFVVLLVLAMEGAGGIMSLGAKLGYAAKIIG
uniref:hypothetical protein n=1 Tax=Pararhizobium sp. IMCC3301 TaxID=3067904 RepID=UPI00274223A0|nr:hypothetical protein [Pararhizobium sp. IMCC3301]